MKIQMAIRVSGNLGMSRAGRLFASVGAVSSLFLSCSPVYAADPAEFTLRAPITLTTTRIDTLITRGDDAPAGDHVDFFIPGGSASVDVESAAWIDLEDGRHGDGCRFTLRFTQFSSQCSSVGALTDECTQSLPVLQLAAFRTPLSVEVGSREERILNASGTLSFVNQEIGFGGADFRPGYDYQGVEIATNFSQTVYLERIVCSWRGVPTPPGGFDATREFMENLAALLPQVNLQLN